MGKECFIPMSSISRITDFKDGKIKGLAIHGDGSYDYQVELTKVRTYEEVIAIIRESGMRIIE